MLSIDEPRGMSTTERHLIRQH